MTFEELSQSVIALQRRLTGYPPEPPTGSRTATLASPEGALLPAAGNGHTDEAPDGHQAPAAGANDGAANRRPAPPGSLLHDLPEIDSLAELGLAMEELEVATEELRQQNEQLALAAARIEAERRRYRDLFESAPDASLVTDRMGITREINQAGARLLNLPASFVLSKPLIVFVPIAERPRFRRLIGQAWADGQAEHCDFTLQPRRRPAVRAEITVSTFHDIGDNARLLRWLVRDAGERQPVAAPQAGPGPTRWPTEGLAIKSMLAGQKAREAELTQLLEETVLVLRKTKGAFRSKELGALRVRLEAMLGNLGEL